MNGSADSLVCPAGGRSIWRGRRSGRPGRRAGGREGRRSVFVYVAREQLEAAARLIHEEPLAVKSHKNTCCWSESPQFTHPSLLWKVLYHKCLKHVQKNITPTHVQAELFEIKRFRHLILWNENKLDWVVHTWSQTPGACIKYGVIGKAHSSRCILFLCFFENCWCKRTIHLEQEVVAFWLHCYITWQTSWCVVCVNFDQIKSQTYTKHLNSNPTNLTGSSVHVVRFSLGSIRLLVGS